jgi:hypothetical protein
MLSKSQVMLGVGYPLAEHLMVISWPMETVWLLGISRKIGSWFKMFR